MNPLQSGLGAGARWTVWGCYSILLLGASLVPLFFLEGMRVPLVPTDKLAHLAAYGLYAVISLWALAVPASHALRLAVVTAYCTAYGLCMELLQAWLVPHLRSCEAADVAANAAGALLFGGLYVVLRRMITARA